MTFFEQQIVARKQSRKLIALFALAIFSIVLIIYVGTRILLYKFSSGYSKENWIPENFWDPSYFFAVTGGVTAVIAIVSLIKIFELTRGGGPLVAQLMGGRLVHPDTSDYDERRLLNIIEEMAIASGLTIPMLYVIDADRSINAFTAGIRPSETVITVSRGAMRLLNRDELQGVVAHEFSHIFHGDVRLNIKLMGLLYGILFLAIAGQKLLKLGFHTSRRSRRDSHNVTIPLIAFGALLAIVGYIGVFFAQIIQYAVSRQREYLADASAVQYTRLNSGLAGALKKIGGLSYGSYLSSPFTKMASHLFFADGVQRHMFSLLTTHPPLVDRIKRLEPGFDGIYEKIEFQSDRIMQAADSSAQHSNLNLQENAQPETAPHTISSLKSQPAFAMVNQLVGLVGTLTPANITAAQNKIEQTPDLVRHLAREPLGAKALLYACLLDSNENVRLKQLALVRNFETKSVVATLNQLHYDRPEFLKDSFTIAELCLPALRQISAQQFDFFKDVLSKLIRSDDQVEIAEYTLFKFISEQLSRHFHKESSTKQLLDAQHGLYPTVSMLLAQLAALTSPSPLESFAAYQAGAEKFRIAKDKQFSESNFPTKNLEDFDLSLSLVGSVEPQYRADLLNAAITVITFNEHISIEEYDLIRVLAATLECPLPALGA
jgi:Zn-dependent protease with chaperone function